MRVNLKVGLLIGCGLYALVTIVLLTMALSQIRHGISLDQNELKALARTHSVLQDENQRLMIRADVMLSCGISNDWEHELTLTCIDQNWPMNYEEYMDAIKEGH
jgi:hypothetical protein